MGAHGEQGSVGAFDGGSAFSSDVWNHLRDIRYYQRIDSPPLLWYQHGGSMVSLRQAWSYMVLVALNLTLSGSLAFMFGANDSKQVEMGLNYSCILKANRFFFDSITVKNLEQVPGARLYNFENQPFFNRTKEWTVHQNILMPGFHHQEWAFWLNRGSKVNVVYSLPPTSNLLIIVVRGKANFSNWIQDPLSSDSCLLWRFVHGNGQISFESDNDGDYYFGLGNLDEQSVETTLEIDVKNKIYETQTANSECSLDQKSCKVLLSFFGSEVGLLTTTDMPQEGIDIWRVEISYKARWKIYLLFDGALLFAIFLICLCLCKLCNQHNLRSEESLLNLHDSNAHSGEAISERSPILKNIPNLKMIATTDTAVEETTEENVCIICFEKGINSFFQPCGHCATCYSCGLRVKEASGLCPMCRKPIQDIRKIFTV